MTPQKIYWNVQTVIVKGGKSYLFLSLFVFLRTTALEKDFKMFGN